jgi:hypothetical protein
MSFVFVISRKDSGCIFFVQFFFVRYTSAKKIIFFLFFLFQIAMKKFISTFLCNIFTISKIYQTFSAVLRRLLIFHVANDR